MVSNPLYLEQYDEGIAYPGGAIVLRYTAGLPDLQGIYRTPVQEQVLKHLEAYQNYQPPERVHCRSRTEMVSDILEDLVGRQRM